MRKIYIYLVVAACVLSLTGCPSSKTTAPVVSPPFYGRGDAVALREGGQQVGIVLSLTKNRNKINVWSYNVLFRDNEMQYDEDQLRLVERFDWNRPVTKGEIDVGKPVKVDP